MGAFFCLKNVNHVYTRAPIPRILAPIEYGVIAITDHSYAAREALGFQNMLALSRALAKAEGQS